MQRSQSLTRRGFLAGMGAAAAAPCVITSTALGAPGVPPASDRVTVGKIGCGGRASALGGVGGQVVAVSDCWKDRRDRWVERAKCRAYADFREMLACDDIDAVVVATTDSWHVHHTVAAAKAGKDVYCEKPLGVSVQEDQICRDVIKRYSRMFQYGTQQRSIRHCRFGCELVRNGYIGEVKDIVVFAPDSVPGMSAKPSSVPKTLDYDMWLGPAPWRPYCGQASNGGTWWHDYDYAIGFIAGWGAHPLDILVWGYDTHLAGTWDVQGTGFIPTDGRNNVVMRWNVNIRFANGVTMNFRTGENYTQFTGTKGWVGISRGRLVAEPESLLTVKLKENEHHLIESRDHGNNFIQSVKTRQTPVSNIDDAVRSDIISHISEIAVRSKRKIIWDPVKEEIVGDPDASRRLTRAWRAPWKLA
jgi:glucose-fructose oxidoreductase